MKRHIAWIAAGALGLSLAAPASAAPFFGLTGGGSNLSQGSCSGLAQSIGPQKVWFSQFSGYQPDPWDQGLWHAWGIGCFKTYKECKSWLYNSQSTYPQLMDFTFCKQGLPARF